MGTDENRETEHEENPGSDPNQLEDLPSSPGSEAHTDENEETVITSSKKLVSLHSCKDY